MGPKFSNLGYGMSSLIGTTRDKSLEASPWRQGPHVQMCLCRITDSEYGLERVDY